VLELHNTDTTAANIVVALVGIVVVPGLGEPCVRPNP